MTIKTAKKFMKMSALLGFVALGSVSLNAAAAVISFGTGAAGYGGELTSSGGGQWTGSDINIGTLTLAGTTADGTYKIKQGVMNFDTAASTLTIAGKIAGLGLTSVQTLLTGTTSNFSYSFDSSSNLNFFSADGASELSDDLLSAVGLNLGTDFDYFGYTVDSNQLQEVVNAAVVNTSTPSAVPLPAAAWLFGSAIIGLFGIARRKRA
jgi:hypothetical protein